VWHLITNVLSAATDTRKEKNNQDEGVKQVQNKTKFVSTHNSFSYFRIDRKQK
jgi:hypothetical protein